MINIKSGWQRFKELYRARHEPEYLRPLAEMIWRGILMLIVIGAAAVLFFGATEFWRVLDNLASPSGSAGNPRPGLDRTKLDATLQAIQMRQQSYETLKTAPVPIADPSK